MAATATLGTIRIASTPPATSYTGFRVYRNDGGGYALIGVSRDGTFIDTPPSAFTDYTYALTTVNNDVESVFSPSIAARSVNTPAQVGQVAITPGAGSLAINAAPVGHADGYRLYVSLISGDLNPPAVLTSDSPSFTLNYLYDTTAVYHARMTAYNAYGEGPASEEAAASPLYPNRPNPWIEQVINLA
jgi:hypothetical protein